ncbi:MAG TPA: TCP-1/cpn60 chaperonin family protein [Pyrinomonadaceae bacterium]|jgi:chaperonin GroEL|nr:TCP-1/cpn60 chaperonin family protein [Pyrinomonadaceae bacterium]
MPTQKQKRTKVFISYSRQDKSWLERLRVHLKPLQRDLDIDIWDDSKIRPGTKWKEEIANVIASTRVAVLLVSADFIASDFIARDEVPPLLAAAKEDGAVIVPLILSPSRFSKTKGLADFQSINDPGEPFVNMSRVRQEEVLFQLAELIEESFTSGARAKPADPPSEVPAAPEQPARVTLKSPHDIPEVSAILAEMRAQLHETLREAGAAEVGAQIAATVLVEGLQAIARRAHPKRLASALSQRLEVAAAHIVGRSKPLTGEAVRQFLLLHSGDEDVVWLVNEAVEKVGRDGVVVVEPGRTEFDLDIVEGLQFDRGYLSPEFITDHEKNRVVIDNPLILLLDGRLQADDINPLLSLLASKGVANLAVIAEDTADDALSVLISADLFVPSFNTVAVKAPGFGDRRRAMLEDMAILTGGSVIVGPRRIGEVGLEALGKADKIIVDEESTIIVAGDTGMGLAIAARIKEIRQAIEETASDYDREKLQERLAKLVGGVAIVRVGGRTKEERRRKMELVERTLGLLRAALEEGVVPGEHLSLVNAAAHLREQPPDGEDQVANSILAVALESPLQRMAEELGRSGEETLLTIRSTQKQKKNNLNVGYYSDEDSFVDLVKAGVTVPTRNVMSLVRTAVGLAAHRLAAVRYTDEVVRQLSPRPERS